MDQLQQSPIRNPEEVATQAARFEHLCRLIVRDRAPYVPINGVLVLLPFAATDSDQDALDTGATCEQDLEVIHRTLQVHAPTLALVCDLETAPGFADFIQCFHDKQRHQRVGHRAPLVPDLDTWAGKSDGDAKARGAMLDGLAQWVFSAVVSGWVGKHFRREAPGRDDVTTVTQANAQLFLFMNELRERRRRLGRLLARGFVLENNVPLWFGGCYVAGTGPDPENQQGFVAGVFRRLIEEEKKGLVSWTAEAVADESGYQRWIGMGQIALGVFVAAVVLVGVAVWLWK
jgi:IcmF-related N-terminal domain